MISICFEVLEKGASSQFCWGFDVLEELSQGSLELVLRD